MQGIDQEELCYNDRKPLEIYRSRAGVVDVFNFEHLRVEKASNVG